jgi:hypothetical protein
MDLHGLLRGYLLSEFRLIWVRTADVPSYMKASRRHGATKSSGEIGLLSVELVAHFLRKV